jgi:hypothetical protein
MVHTPMSSDKSQIVDMPLHEVMLLADISESIQFPTLSYANRRDRDDWAFDCFQSKQQLAAVQGTDEIIGSKRYVDGVKKLYFADASGVE